MPSIVQFIPLSFISGPLKTGGVPVSKLYFSSLLSKFCHLDCQPHVYCVRGKGSLSAYGLLMYYITTYFQHTLLILHHDWWDGKRPRVSIGVRGRGHRKFLCLSFLPFLCPLSLFLPILWLPRLGSLWLARPPLCLFFSGPRPLLIGH